ncbi:hypothetical protein L596_017658 [Steinernema carpocapsae]|uniref:DDRGK domain-containing protein 1 n=1 Tax=Steinernema carpocapsae TaxID=34508 RepID=A0A4U5N2R0_STECR|nr:hypothetical protein L596_017658 [Steinernema carpocapsae]
MAEMDPMLLGSVGVLFSALFLIVARLIKLHWDEQAARRRTEALLAMTDQGANGERQRDAVVVGGRRRAGGRRRVNLDEEEDNSYVNALMRDAAGDDPEEDEDFDPMSPEALGADANVGKKKLAKLQAKAEKRAHREYELQEREERKKREAERERQMDERRKAEEDKEKAQELKEQQEREERERREHEEYLKMKEQFEVGEEGFDQLDEEESENLMRDFVNYVQSTKVVYMDDLAKQFRLRTEDAVSRLNFFLENETLSGVFDDRGKFIYITQEEMQADVRCLDLGSSLEESYQFDSASFGGCLAVGSSRSVGGGRVLLQPRFGAVNLE